MRLFSEYQRLILLSPQTHDHLLASFFATLGQELISEKYTRSGLKTRMVIFGGTPTRTLAF